MMRRLLLYSSAILIEISSRSQLKLFRQEFPHTNGNFAYCSGTHSDQLEPHISSV
jgi:hypothetical protein